MGSTATGIQFWMRTEGPHDLTQTPRIDLGGASGEYPLRDGLVRPARELAK